MRQLTLGNFYKAIFLKLLSFKLPILKLKLSNL